MWTSGVSTRSTGRSGSSSSPRRPALSRSTRPGSRTRSRRGLDARARNRRRRALRTGGARRAGGAAVRGRRALARGRRREASGRRRLRRARGELARGRDRGAGAGGRGRPLRRARARPAGAAAGREPRAGAGTALPRPGLPLRSAGARAVSATVAVGDRDGQARRQDRGHRTRGTAARPRPRRRRGGNGTRRAPGAGGRRGRADAGAPARALARRPSRRLRLPRDGGAGRRRHDRLPTLWRGARRLGRRVERARRGRAGRRARAGPRYLRRQRRCNPAGRHRRARPRHQHRAATGGLDRLPERLPDPGLRPRRRHGWARRAAGRGDPGREGAAGGAGGAAPAPGHARRGPARGVLLDRAGRGARGDRAAPARGARRGGRARLGEPGPPRRPERGARPRRRRALPGRDQGGRDRRRRRGGARARRGRGVRGQRARPGGRPRPRRRARAACRRGCSQGGGAEVTDRRFRQPLPLGSEDGLPFSKGLMARSLVAAGLTADRAYELALALEADLAKSDRQSVSLARLEELAHESLGPQAGAVAMRRLRRYQDLYDLDLPIILLVGGGTGTGKSSVATDVAYRLGITRVTSTDFVRQTMRAFFSREFMPAIHYSSFEAGLGLSKAEEEESGDAALLGFIDQTRNVLTGVEAALQRALDEGWSMVLEGVHLVPGMITTELREALVVQCVLAIRDEEIHRTHFWIRDATSDGVRPVDRYIAGLPEIRMIQDYIVERARRCDVPIVQNESALDAVGSVMELVLERAERAAQ